MIQRCGTNKAMKACVTTVTKLILAQKPKETPTSHFGFPNTVRSCVRYHLNASFQVNTTSCTSCTIVSLCHLPVFTGVLRLIITVIIIIIIISSSREERRNAKPELCSSSSSSSSVQAVSMANFKNNFWVIWIGLLLLFDIRNGNGDDEMMMMMMMMKMKMKMKMILLKITNVCVSSLATMTFSTTTNLKRRLSYTPGVQ